MRYFKELNEKGWIDVLGAGDALDGIEITKEEYNFLMNEATNKMNYAEGIYSNQITINEVPEEWKEEVQFRVDEMIEAFGEFNQVSDADQAAEEALAILAGDKVV